MMTMLRRANALWMHYDGTVLVAENILSSRRCPIDWIHLDLLARMHCWQGLDQLFEAYDLSLRPIVAAALETLEQHGILLRWNTPEAARDEEYAAQFSWGDKAAIYHFGIRGTHYMAPDEFADWMVERKASVPAVALQTRHAPDSSIALPDPPETDATRLMGHRRSSRGFSRDSLPLDALSDCLFSGFGISGYLRGSFQEGDLPFSMTPSGGARNPYEAYVYAHNVEGLAPGTYHYSASQHSLSPVNLVDHPPPGDILGEQRWFDNAAAVVLLVAHFERTMWKYPHPTGYRVVMLEAGHIAQNILLAATERGLASCPTCAVSDELAERLTLATGINRTTMYTVSLGLLSRAPSAVDPIGLRKNAIPTRKEQAPDPVS